MFLGVRITASSSGRKTQVLCALRPGLMSKGLSGALNLGAPAQQIVVSDAAPAPTHALSHDATSLDAAVTTCEQQVTGRSES